MVPERGMASRAVTGAGRAPGTPWTLLLCCGLILAPGLLAATQTAAGSESNVLNPVETGHFKRTRESVSDRLKSSGDVSEHRHSASAVNSGRTAGSRPAGPAGSGVDQNSTPALTSETVISNSPGAWAAADLSPVGVRSGQQLPIVPVSLVLPSARVKRSVTPSVRGTQDTSDRAQPDRQARAATVIQTASGSQTSASPWDPQASFNAEPRTGRASKPDVNSVLSSIISLLGDNVRLVGPPADRAPNRGPNRQRPRPNPGRPASPTRINNRGPPQQFVPVKNRPAPPVKTRPVVRPYPSHLPPPLRPRPGQRPPRPQLTPGRPQRPPIAPYANGIPLPERLVPLQGEPLSPAVTTSFRQTVVTDAGKVSSSVPASKTPAPSSVSSTATSSVATVATAVPGTTTTQPPPETEPQPEAQAETTEKAEAAEGGGSGGSSEEKVPTTAVPERETSTEPAGEVTRRPTAPPRPEEAVTPPETTTEDAVTTAPPPPPRPSGPAGSNQAASDPPRAPPRAPQRGPARDRPRDPVRKPAREPAKTPERSPAQTPWVEIPSTANVPLSSSESSVPEFGGRPAAGRPAPSATPPLSVRPTSGQPGTVLNARPGVVVDATRRRPPPLRPQVFNPQRVGDVFDITVSAAQGGFGGGPVRRPPRPQPPSGQPYVIPVDINQLRGPGDIITEPDAVNNVVSIDGRRTYFDLSPTDTNAGGTYQTVGAGLGLGGQAPSNFPPAGGQSRPSVPPSYQQPQWPQEGAALPAPPPRQPPRQPPQQRPQPPPQGRPQPSASSFQRRRPSPPPIRIDTCIVGDDSTCKREFNERCKTEAGVSSCHCRPGYSRLRPRTACKRVVSVVMTMKVDGIGDSRLAWQAALRNPRSEAFQQLAWDAEHAVATSMSGTTMRDIYMGNKVTSFYLLRGGVALNTTVSLLDTAQTRRQQVMDELQRQMNRAIRANDNIIGESNLFVEGLSSPVPRVLDLDECDNSDEHDCDENAECSNVFGSFTCQCRSGYDDRYRTDAQKAGRYCLSCTDDYCSDRGTCQIFDGEKTCQCRGSYYGARCDIDGEVLGAALGATAAAAVIIVATFICLCKWSKRWHKGQGHTKVEMGTLGAASGYSFMKPSAAAAAHANFQMGVEERLRWAQMAEAIGHQNLYAPEPMYGGGGGGLSLYASQPNLPGPAPDGPASLNMARAGRPPFPAQALRAMTPAYAGGERGPMGVPMGRTLRTPLPHPPTDDDGPVRPRSRGSMAYDYSTLSAHDFPLQGVGSGSQQQLVYSSGRQQRPRHARSSSRDSIYETLSPHLGGTGATQLLTFDPKRDDKLFEKSNSWRMAF